MILQFVSKQKTDDEMSSEEPMDVCALCQNDFPILQLLEKEVGTYGRIYCFCWDCVELLYNEFKEKTGIKTGE